MVRKLTVWKPEEVSSVYWMCVWGYKPKDIMAICSDVLPGRTPMSIGWMQGEVRKFLSEGAKLLVLPERIAVPNSTKALIRKASKIDPVKGIAEMKQDKTFIPYTIGAERTKGTTKTPQFQQVVQNEVGNHREPYNRSDKPKVDEPIWTQIDSSRASELNKPVSIVDSPDLRPLTYDREGRGTPQSEMDRIWNILHLAKAIGAKEVHYKDFIIKFKVNV